MKLNKNIELFTPAAIRNAWLSVKNKGAGGGVDAVSVADFELNLEDNLSRLYTELVSASYVPEPYLQILIKKENKKEFRPLGLLTVKDKIVQTCVNTVYSEKLDKIFVDSSYAYRKSKGHFKAIRRIKDYLTRKYAFVLPLDIDNFFDTINREILFEKCRDYFHDPFVEALVKMWVKIGVIYKEKYIDTGVGIAQGGVISPLLSNLYLHSFDKMLLEKKIANVRYADNILLLSKNPDALKEAYDATTNFLGEKLCLRLNDSGSAGIDVNNGFVFCGIYFKDGLCRISDKKIYGIKESIKKIVSGTPLAQMTKKLNPHLGGVLRYYYSFDTADQIKELNSILINTLSGKIKNESLTTPLTNKELKNFLKDIILIDEEDKIRGVTYFISKIRKNEGTDGTQTPPAVSDKDIERKILYKKRKYKKIWYENLEIVICNEFSQIGQSKNKITIRREGKIRNEISGDKVKNIIISAKGVTISSNAVKLAAEQNVKIDYFDEIGNPYASIIPSITPVSGLVDLQFEAQRSIKGKVIARELILAKIKNQASLIKYFIKNKSRLEKEKYSVIFDELETYLAKIKDIDLNLDTDDYRDKLLGYEGTSAVSYWGMVKTIIPKEYEFVTREHKNPDNIVNNALNYAYGILYTRVLNAVTVVGLNPNIGFLHREQTNKPVLIYDIIEPFRAPIADRAVFALCNRNVRLKKDKKGFLDNESRSKVSKSVLIRLNKEIIHKGKEINYSDILLNQVKEIRGFLENDAKRFKGFLSKW
ncbi:MAG: CRISPR-associated endonuclease Cas1 [Ignavibacteriales bacterium]|nr:CRISPR-associated endonuclease Cas1 [Ignavibacteriales bacterium]